MAARRPYGPMLSAAMILLSSSLSLAREVAHLSLENGVLRCTVNISKGRLAGDALELLPPEESNDDSRPVLLSSDAGLSLDMMWTGWLAPGKVHNADNEVCLRSSDLKITDHRLVKSSSGGQRLEIELGREDLDIQVRVVYRLDPGEHWIRRQLQIRDPEEKGHFLHRLSPIDSRFEAEAEIVKSGGFGEPIAVAFEAGGAFIGLEYPAGTNRIALVPDGGLEIRTGQEIGEQIGGDWIESDWAVLGLTPDHNLKLAFDGYIDSIRIAPPKPYLLYNTWYDVRSPEYTERPEDVMNEANLLRIIADFTAVRDRYPELALDAFLLDDAWDIYASDWQLREEEFPNGLAPVKQALQALDSDLGIWFGPTGGYSFRQRRIDWMKDNGFEVVGDQLCVAGENYGELLRRRVSEFVSDLGTAYFKWDGIQFSCSEPDHGHPVGVYSRTAVMNSVIDLCDTVRELDPDIFLNITSGTWLSPWWLKYADTIWMQGRDYGWSDVPSISRRDAAITYRDVVLHEDYQVHGVWFPITGLMTHGIIKGHLQKLGGEAEPLDKFTDNAILYFARGVSMWELYVSPNLLSEGEWKALDRSVAWARDRFDILKRTEMIGGDPGEGEPYGYTHFAGERGIIAVRNPSITAKDLAVSLDPAQGLDPNASLLVLERIYPNRHISHHLVSAGETVSLPLGGYETAVYEIYPLEGVQRPLVAGTVFETLNHDATSLRLVGAEGPVRLLNPETVGSATVDGEPRKPDTLGINPAASPLTPITGAAKLVGNSLQISLEVPDSVDSAQIAILTQPDSSASEISPESLGVDGSPVRTHVESQEDAWSWVTAPVEPGSHRAELELENDWTGKLSAWLIAYDRPPTIELELEPIGELEAQSPMPPSPWPESTVRRTISLGSVTVE